MGSLRSRPFGIFLPFFILYHVSRENTSSRPEQSGACMRCRHIALKAAVWGPQARRRSRRNGPEVRLPARKGRAACGPAPRPAQAGGDKKAPGRKARSGERLCTWEQVPYGPFTSRYAVGAPEGYAVVPSPEVPEAAGFVPPLSPPPSPPSPPGVGGVGGVDGFCCRSARSCCSCSSVLPAGL